MHLTQGVFAVTLLPSPCNMADSLPLPAAVPPAPEPSAAGKPYAAKYISIERRNSADTVFVIDDSQYRSAMPPSTHWSVGWSDLMMTMFILFLVLYLYKSANEEFLVTKSPEVIAGDTTVALDGDRLQKNLPPITATGQRGAPLITSGTIKKVERVSTADLDFALPDFIAPPPLPQSIAKPSPPVESTHPGAAAIARQHNMYRLGQSLLRENQLHTVAAIEMLPEAAVRLTLSSDLLFASGQAEMSIDGRLTLGKLAALLQSIPFMIEVAAHTDELPAASASSASNWELSVAQASTVARILHEEMAIQNSQFTVSGSAAFSQPQRGSDTAFGAKKRRVEITITQRLPEKSAAAAAVDR